MVFKEIGEKAYEPSGMQLEFSTHLKQAMDTLYLLPPSLGNGILANTEKAYVVRGKGVAVAPSGAQATAPANTQFGADASGTSSYVQFQVQIENTLSMMDEKSIYTVRVMGISTDDNGKKVPSDRDNYKKGVLEITGTKEEIKTELYKALEFKRQNERMGSTPFVQTMEEMLAAHMLSMKIDGIENPGVKNGEIGTATALGSQGNFTITYIKFSNTGNDYLNKLLDIGEGKPPKYFALGGGEGFILSDVSASCIDAGKQTEENVEPQWKERMGSVSAVSKALSYKFNITVVSSSQEQTELHSELVNLVQNGAQGEDGKPSGAVRFVNDYAKSAESKIEYALVPEIQDNSDVKKEIHAINSIPESQISKDFTLAISSGGNATVFGDFAKNDVRQIEYETISTVNISGPQWQKNALVLTDGSFSMLDFGSAASGAVNDMKGKQGVTVEQFERGTNVPDSEKADNDNVLLKVQKLAAKAKAGKADAKAGKLGYDVIVLFTDGGDQPFDDPKYNFKEDIRALKESGVEIRLVLYKGSGSDEVRCGKELWEIINPGSEVSYVNTKSQVSIISGLTQAIDMVSLEDCTYKVATTRHTSALITYNDGRVEQTYLPLSYVNSPDLLRDVGIIPANAPKPPNAFWE